MAVGGSSSPKAMQEGSSSYPKGGGVSLGRWVFCSFLLHVAVVWSLFAFPHVPSRRDVSYPVYTVDLVGGERIGAEVFSSTIAPPPRPAKAPQKVKMKPPAPKPEVKREEVKKEKKKAVESPPPMTEKVPLTEKVPPKGAQAETKAETPKEEPRSQGLSDEVREKLIQAAVERVKERTEPKKKEEVSPGSGEGEGTAVTGPQGKGGDVVRGVEFLIYRNRMLYLIRERWTWVGKKSDLEVTVRFGILENGEIIGLRIIQSSGDPSYDDSVIRAVKKVSPLPPPPENYRKDFMDVELTFRPKDLGA